MILWCPGIFVPVDLDLLVAIRRSTVHVLDLRTGSRNPRHKKDGRMIRLRSYMYRIRYILTKYLML